MTVFQEKNSSTPNSGFAVNLKIVIGEKNLSCESKEFAIIAIELLSSGKTLRFTAKGGSMDPLIRDGDTLFLAPADPSRIKLGDVVFISDEEGRPRIHRVIKINGHQGQKTFLVHGDRSNCADGTFPPDRVFGKVTAIEREGQWISFDQPLYRLLGRLAGWYSRNKPVNTGFYHDIFQILKKLPIFKRYLS